MGSLEINLAQIEVHGLFRKIWALSGELIKRRSLRGTFKIDKATPELLLLDAHRINQVMMNLIGNAIKFTERGSFNVSVNWHEDAVKDDKIFEPRPYDDENEGIFEKNQCICFLDISSKDNNSKSFAYETNNYYHLNSRKSSYDQNESRSLQREIKGVLKIIISNTGCGMTNDSLEQLFQKFSQVSNDPNKRKVGTGLGLFITKEICDKMEADIKVYSKVDKGTTFIICIPTMSVLVKTQFQIPRS